MEEAKNVEKAGWREKEDRPKEALLQGTLGDKDYTEYHRESKGSWGTTFVEGNVFEGGRVGKYY